MNKNALFCTNCNAQLTNWIEPINTASGMNKLCNLPSTGKEEAEYDVQPVPTGFVLHMADAVLAAYQIAVPYWNPENEPQFWINLADLENHVGWAQDSRRLSGCCGPDGMGGPNRVCECGQDIGTESSDCWTFHMFIPEMKNTEWRYQK